MLRWAIELSRLNVAHGSGGPFGAAIFCHDTGELVSSAVNRVVELGNSCAHAEMLAFMFAQARLGRARLNADGRQYTLATSAQPCAMCFGAVAWAGIDRVLVGARKEDVEGIVGFDEGPVPEDWVGALAARGIAVRVDIERAAACEVLRAYARAGECY